MKQETRPRSQQVNSSRFGPLSVQECDVIRFERPLLGLEESRDFVILHLKEYEPFLWLQSLDQGEMCFALADPWKFYQDYQPKFEQNTLDELGLCEEDEVAVYCVVGPSSEGLSLNLAAPIILHQARRIAAQVVLDDGQHSLAAPLRGTSC